MWSCEAIDRGVVQHSSPLAKCGALLLLHAAPICGAGELQHRLEDLSNFTKQYAGITRFHSNANADELAKERTLTLVCILFYAASVVSRCQSHSLAGKCQAALLQDPRLSQLHVHILIPPHRRTHPTRSPSRCSWKYHFDEPATPLGRPETKPEHPSDAHLYQCRSRTAQHALSQRLASAVLSRRVQLSLAPIRIIAPCR